MNNKLKEMEENYKDTPIGPAIRIEGNYLFVTLPRVYWKFLEETLKRVDGPLDEPIDEKISGYLVEKICLDLEKTAKELNLSFPGLMHSFAKMYGLYDEEEG